MQHPASRIALIGLTAATLVLLAAASHVAHAVTVRVPADYSSIGQALADTTIVSGDTILVAAGTYAGVGNRNLRFWGRNLVLRSEAGPHQTIIDVATEVDSSHRAFLFEGGPWGTVDNTAVVEGFTIINGRMGVSSKPGSGRGLHEQSGGGMMFRFGAAPTIRHCIIRDCHSGFSGGGVGVEFDAAPVFENVVIEACTTPFFGGGVSTEFNAHPVFINSTIKGCAAKRGGGLYLNADASLQGCLVTSNASEVAGGIDATWPTNANLVQTIVWGNCAVDSADQVWVDPAFIDFGGGVTFDCSIVDTTGVLDRGGVVSWGGSTNVYDDPLLCDPAACGSVPTSQGNYAMLLSSPAAAANNSCNVLIGPGPIGCTTSDVLPKPVPDRIVIHNAPDPFNPMTTIEYQLPRAGLVEIAIFDARGQRVRTLVRGFREAGSGSVEWAGRNDDNRSAGSGIYWVRIVAAGATGVDRLTLIR